MRKIIFYSSVVFLIFMGCTEIPVCDDVNNEISDLSSIEISWEKVPYKTDLWNANGRISKVFINSKKKLFTVVEHNLKYSIDLGGNWNPLSGNINYIDNSDNLFYDVTWDGIYKSIDDGVNWSKIERYSSVSLRLFNNSKDILYTVGIQNDLDDKSKYILHSTVDNGQIWKWLFRADGFYLNKNDWLYAWLDNSLFISFNNGIEWELLSEVEQHITDLKEDKDGNFYMSTYGSEFFRSEDSGKSWNKIATNIDFFSFTITNGNKIILNTFNSIYEFDRSNETFNELLTAPYDWFIGASVNSIGSKIFVSTSEKGLFISEDDGKTWSSVSFRIPEVRALAFGSNERIITNDYFVDDGYWFKNTEGFNYANSIVVNSLGTIFKPHSRGVLKSIDNGETFNEISIPSSGPQEEDLIISETDELYLAFSHGHLYKSNTSADNWIKLLNTEDMWVYDLMIQGNTIYFGTENGLFISYDSGVSWDTTLVDNKVLSVVVDSKETLYAANQYELKSSNDSGKTWHLQPYSIQKLYSDKLGILLIGIDAFGASYYLSEGSKVWKEIEYARNMYATAVCFNKENDKILLGTRNNGILLGRISKK